MVWPRLVVLNLSSNIRWSMCICDGHNCDTTKARYAFQSSLCTEFFTITLCNFFSSLVHYTLLNVTGAIHWSLQYVVWVGFSLVLVLFSMIFCHLVAPQATGLLKDNL